MRRRRQWWPAAALLAGALVLVGAVGLAYRQRIGPQFPAVQGTPYSIDLAADGCPVVPESSAFVDTPGQLVPESPVEVVLCTTPNLETDPSSGPARQRILIDGAAEFAALLNQMPDRNRWFRDWQREHSGFWPDPVPEFVCNLMLPAYEFSFVLRYADGTSVPLVTNCTGWTTGVRTRINNTRPGIVDEFIARFEAE